MTPQKQVFAFFTLCVAVLALAGSFLVPEVRRFFGLASDHPARVDALPSFSPTSTPAVVAAATATPPPVDTTFARNTPTPVATPPSERFTVDEDQSVTTSDGTCTVFISKIFTNRAGVDATITPDAHRPYDVQILVGQRLQVAGRSHTFYVTLHGFRNDLADSSIARAP